VLLFFVAQGVAFGLYYIVLSGRFSVYVANLPFSISASFTRNLPLIMRGNNW
jgi:hypothetical protein